MHFKESIPKYGLVLFAYFRSSSSWRVRTILNLKNISYTIIPVNLLKGEQNSKEYAEINPLGAVPCLRSDGEYLAESMAIAEYLEERFPDNPCKLLPIDLIQRARVREICEAINAGMQPLQNLRVLNAIDSQFKGDRIQWAKQWNDAGFATLDKLLAQTKGKHAVGDQITLADVFIFPQFVNAVARFKIDPLAYPNVKEVVDNVRENEAFVKGLPENQPDFQ